VDGEEIYTTDGLGAAEIEGEPLPGELSRPRAPSCGHVTVNQIAGLFGVIAGTRRPTRPGKGHEGRREEGTRVENGEPSHFGLADVHPDRPEAGSQTARLGLDRHERWAHGRVDESSVAHDGLSPWVGEDYPSTRQVCHAEGLKMWRCAQRGSGKRRLD